MGGVNILVGGNIKTTENMYLDKTLKTKYYNDFIENVLTETDTFWKINQSIRNHLINLNECKNIQPLYSKFPDNKNSFSNDDSLLTIAYTREIELVIFKDVLPLIGAKYFTDKQAKFAYYFDEDGDNANYSEDPTKFKMGCISDPDYFRINKIRIMYSNWDRDAHEKYWQYITEKFMELSN